MFNYTLAITEHFEPSLEHAIALLAPFNKNKFAIYTVDPVKCNRNTVKNHVFRLHFYMIYFLKK